jgi:hypothetical protein
VPYAVAAALIVLAGSGSAAFALKHKHAAADARPAVTVTITVPPKAAATSSQPAPTASASPTTLPIAPPYTTEPAVTVSSSSPAVSPGTLLVSTTFLRLSSQGSGTFTVTAEGGPVTYSLSVPSGLTVSPVTRTLNPGQPQVITVTASATAGLEPTVTVNPGDISVTIYNTPIS